MSVFCGQNHIKAKPQILSDSFYIMWTKFCSLCRSLIEWKQICDIKNCTEGQILLLPVKHMVCSNHVALRDHQILHKFLKFLKAKGVGGGDSHRWGCRPYCCVGLWCHPDWAVAAVWSFLWQETGRGYSASWTAGEAAPAAPAETEIRSFFFFSMTNKRTQLY